MRERVFQAPRSQRVSSGIAFRSEANFRLSECQPRPFRPAALSNSSTGNSFGGFSPANGVPAHRSLCPVVLEDVSRRGCAA